MDATTTKIPGQSSTSDADHFEAIEVEPEAGEAAPAEDAPGDATGLPIGSDGLLTAEAFAEGMRVMFLFGHDLTGLETLKAAPERETAAPAARAVYDTIKETPWLHWLLDPNAKWVQRLIVIGMFTVPVYRGCREEIKSRKGKPVQSAGAAPAPVSDTIPQDGAVLAT